MSRIGKLPIAVPSNVTVTLNGLTDGQTEVTVKGPKGQLTKTLRQEIAIKQEDGKLLVSRNGEGRMPASLHGLSRTMVSNMVKGVTDGFEKKLEIVGVGYRASNEGKKLVMALGYSHPVEVEPPAGLEIVASANVKISVKGIDKQAVGDLASFIRSKRPPEVYKGKGVKYEGEVIRRKAGKAAAKKK